MIQFVILSYYHHVTGISDIRVLHRFHNKESACDFFNAHRSDFVDENPVFYLVAEEHEEGYKVLNGNWLQ